MSDLQTVAPTTTPITLAEAKEHLNVSTTADDALIARLVEAATTLLENENNRAFINQTRSLKLDDFQNGLHTHDRRIRPPFSPVSSITSIIYTASDGTSTTMPSTDYVLSKGQPGAISEAYNATWPDVRQQADTVTITYVVGHGSTQSSIPEGIRHAVSVMVADMYRNREGPTLEARMAADAFLARESVPDYG